MTARLHGPLVIRRIAAVLNDPNLHVVGVDEAAGSVTLDYQPPPIRYRIAAPTSSDDRSYIVRSWVDSFHRARANLKLTFRGGYKERQRQAIDRVLDAPGTRVLCAYSDTERVMRDGVDHGPAVLGWIVWTVGRGWPTVHYVFTRYELGQVKWRRRGVMSELVDAAELGPRVVYTHRGEYARGGLESRQRWPRALDEEVADWMRRRGMTVAYVPLGEWL